MKTNHIVGIAIATVAIAACSDTSAPSSELAITMASAYSATPAGFSELTTSFAADSGWIQGTSVVCSDPCNARDSSAFA